MKHYPYDNFKNDTNSLISKVQTFKPDAILGIARGGLTLAHAMAEGLNIRDVQTISTELYDHQQKRKFITVYGECSFKKAKKVLVVDDIADSGETLQVVMEYIKSQNPDTEFKSATLFYKKTSVYEPHFWINEAVEWIEFFWESDFSE
jgi:xanthine phosphoribosyltransferase